ncbi:MAG: copper resistance CopC/CopD family protein [Synechococcales cyanobacterium]
MLLLSGGAAFTHATLLSTTPADGSQIPAWPAEIHWHFSEVVTLTSLQIVAADGRVIPTVVPRERSERMVTPLAPEAEGGVYVVSWRAISADSHPVGGSFVFQVTPGSEPAPESGLVVEPSVEVESLAIDDGKPSLWDPLRVTIQVVRALLYLGSLVSVGVLGFWYARSTAALGFVAVWISLSLTVVAWCLQVAQLYPQLTLAGIPTIVAAPYSWSIGLKLLGLVALLGEKNWRTAGSLLVIASFLPVGHALTSAVPGLTVTLLGLHLLGVAFWLGGLWRVHQEVTIVTRFSDQATWIVPGLVVAGWGMGAIHQGWTGSHPYGFWLGAKLALVLMILGLAAINKFRLVPAFRQGLPSRAVQETLRRTVRLELVGLLAVLGMTTMLVSQAPPQATPISNVVSTAIPIQRNCVESLIWPEVEVQLTITPCLAGENQLRLRVIPPGIQQIRLNLSQPDLGIPPLRRVLIANPAGEFQWQGSELSVAGTWQIQVAALISDFVERRGTLTVTIPRDPDPEFQTPSTP